MATSSPTLTGLAPVIAFDTRVLVLGSFPGAALAGGGQILCATAYARRGLFSVYLKRALNPRENLALELSTSLKSETKCSF